ncbi:Hypothetical_protein [Hexamita inflata]|uniref:Hypothetical_protein n=1 Tax=Hexamita inflata TaxID=28002 RepID=A0ABP1GGX0_9EUKA
MIYGSSPSAASPFSPASTDSWYSKTSSGHVPGCKCQRTCTSVCDLPDSTICCTLLEPKLRFLRTFVFALRIALLVVFSKQHCFHCQMTHDHMLCQIITYQFLNISVSDLFAMCVFAKVYPLTDTGTHQKVRLQPLAQLVVVLFITSFEFTTIVFELGFTFGVVLFLCSGYNTQYQIITLNKRISFQMFQTNNYQRQYNF